MAGVRRKPIFSKLSNGLVHFTEHIQGAFVGAQPSQEYANSLQNQTYDQ